jgi:hypothetical protein
MFKYHCEYYLITPAGYAWIQSSHQYKWSTLIKISAFYASHKRNDSPPGAINTNHLIYLKKQPIETDYNEPDKKQSLLENFVDKRRLNKN